MGDKSRLQTIYEKKIMYFETNIIVIVIYTETSSCVNNKTFNHSTVIWGHRPNITMCNRWCINIMTPCGKWLWENNLNIYIPNTCSHDCRRMIFLEKCIQFYTYRWLYTSRCVKNQHFMISPVNNRNVFWISCHTLTLKRERIISY